MSFMETSLGANLATAALALVALTLAAPDYPQRAVKILDAWALAFFRWLAQRSGQVFLNAGRAAANLPGRVAPGACYWRDCFARSWNGRAEIAGFIAAILAGALLILPFWLALHVESRSNRLALEVVFGSTGTQETASRANIFGMPQDAAPAPGSAEDAGIAQVSAFLIRPFDSLWRTELGPMAIGLAALQGALGLVLFWKMGISVLRVTPLLMARERPLPFAVFLLLDVVIALLAGIRGFAITSNSWSGALLSASLGLTMPWAMAYSLHFIVEAPSALLGLATVFVQILILLVVGLSALLVPVVVVITVLAILGIATLAVLAGWGLTLPIRLIIWCGEAVHRIYTKLSGAVLHLAPKLRARGEAL